MRKISLLKSFLLTVLFASLGLRGQSSAFAQATQSASPVETQNQALAAVQQGYVLLSQKNLAGAEASFRSAVALEPKHAEAHHGLGIVLWREGRKDAALRELTEATKLDPGSASLHLDVARAAWSLADESQDAEASRSPDAEITADSYRSIAIAEMQKALSLQPRDAQTHLSLAELFIEAHQPKSAIDQAQMAAQLQPANAAVFVILGRAYQDQGNDVEATAQYEKAIQLNPHDGESYMAIAELRIHQGNIPEAVKALRSAIAASPNLASAYSALGQILEQAHETGEARSVFERAVALDPNDWRSAYELGKIMAGAGKAQEATAYFQKALQIRPDFPAAREQLALEMVRRGDLAGATAQAQMISARSPQAPEGHRVMALVLWKQRNYSTSLAECAMALQGDSTSLEMLAVQALDLWQEGERRAARQALASAGKQQPNIVSAQVFCGLVLCDARDIAIVSDFLRRNRWVVSPPPE